MRDIKRRISGVQNIQQITRAMELVAATKLRRAQQTVETARPYAEKLQEVLSRLVAAHRADAGRRKPDQHPLLIERDVNKVCYVVITGDRGLAGAYNANVLRLYEETLAREQRPYEIITLGRRGRDHLRRREEAIYEDYTGIGDDVYFNQARDLGRRLVDLYTAGDFDEVNFVYTRFISAGSQQVDVFRLLPLADLVVPTTGDVAPDGGGDEDDGAAAHFVAADEGEDALGPEYIYEPSAAEVLNMLLPRHVDMQVYRTLLEAKASEHASRMRAMRSATDNAGDMIRDLTLSFNRARQAAITTEIAEIVGGAEALQGGLGG